MNEPILTFQAVTAANASRVERWHGIDDWSPLEWAGAMCGEAGEAANFAKKLKRLTTEVLNPDKRGAFTPQEYAKMIGLEVADAVIYGSLLCLAVSKLTGSHVDLGECVREAFNQKSVECGFPERI